jgi:hypothetical protein
MNTPEAVLIAMREPPAVAKTDKVAQIEPETAPTQDGEVVFPIPAGFVPPADVQPNEPFEAVAKFRYAKGKMVLESIEGTEVRAKVSPKTEEMEEEEDEETSFVEAVEEGADEGMA